MQGAEIEINRYNAYPGLDAPIDSPAAQLAQCLVHSNQTTKVAFGTEAGFFDALGISTIVCGPGSMADQGHKADEYIELGQLAACDQMLVGVVKELCA